MAQGNEPRLQHRLHRSASRRARASPPASRRPTGRAPSPVAIDPTRDRAGPRDPGPHLPADGARRRRAGARRPHRGRGRHRAARRPQPVRRDLRDHERRRHHGAPARPRRLRPAARPQGRHDRRPDRLPPDATTGWSSATSRPRSTAASAAISASRSTSTCWTAWSTWRWSRATSPRPSPVLVRVHAVNVLEDLLGEGESGRGDQLHRAMEMIGAAGRGVVVLLREPSPDQHLASGSRSASASSPARPRDLRVYGIGAQILTDLGVKRHDPAVQHRPHHRRPRGLRPARRRDAADHRAGRPLMAGAGAGADDPAPAGRTGSDRRGALLRRTSTTCCSPGARAVLPRPACEVEHVVVPGALEIPPAIAHRASTAAASTPIVALGCVIRGETTPLRPGRRRELPRPHGARRARSGAPIGNGILTVENEAQALVRADPRQQDKGGDAALAALAPARPAAALGGCAHEPARAEADPQQAPRRPLRRRPGALPDRADRASGRSGGGASSASTGWPSCSSRSRPSEPSPAVDREWFELVVAGAWAARERLDAEIERCLAAGWTLARCGYLLRACLRAGAFELAERTDVPVKVVINEYVELAHLFFDDSEPGFVNAVLDRLAPRLRPRRGRPERAVSLGEFELIDRLLKPLARGYPGRARPHRRRRAGRRAGRAAAGDRQGRAWSPASTSWPTTRPS